MFAAMYGRLVKRFYSRRTIYHHNTCFMKKLCVLLLFVYCFACVWLFLSSACLYAQNLPPKDTILDALDVQLLPTLVVTPRKQPEKAITIGKNLFTIEEKQLRHSEATDLSQLLNQTGLTISGSVSSPGEVKNIFIRGASSKYSLMMIDGVPLFDPSGTGGAYDLRLLSSSSFSSVEVMRGSYSTLYGSGAVAGLVNLRSRQPVSDKVLEIEGQTTGGNLGTLRGALALSGTPIREEGRGLRLAYRIDASRNQSDGISTALDTLKKEDQSFDRDPFSQDAISASLYLSHKDLLVRPYLRYSLQNYSYDAAAFTDGPHKEKGRLGMYGLSLDWKYNKASHLYLKLSQQQTLRSYKRPSFDPTLDKLVERKNHGEFRFADLYTNYKISNRFSLLTGLEYRQEKMYTEKRYIAETVAPYAILHTQPFGERLPLHIELGGRLNTHSRFGNNFTYELNPFYIIGGQTKVYATYATSFLAPTLSSLFGVFGPNPALKPEQSEGVEIGVDYQDKATKLLHFGLRTSAFYRKVKDIIIYSYNGYMNRRRTRRPWRRN